MHLLLIIFIVIAIYVVVKSKSKKNQNVTKTICQKEIVKFDVDEIVNSMQNLGYFKYTATENIDELKKEIALGLTGHQYLRTIHESDKPYNSKDFRHYSLDGEDLYEKDGFVDKINEMGVTFDKLKVNMTITNHFEEWDEKNKWLNHTISINNKEYIIFKNFKETGWGEAAQRFAEIINDQLELQGSDERLYLANGGNEGEAVFLTEAQFDLLDPILKSEIDRPLRIKDWCRIMHVNPMPNE